MSAQNENNDDFSEMYIFNNMCMIMGISIN